MILAGIDEAGLGPTLGPLATASAVLSVPSGWEADSPWKHLAASVCARKARGDARFVVADSKVAYARNGLRGLEATVAACLACAHDGAGRAALPVRWSECGTGAGNPFPYPWHLRELKPFSEDARKDGPVGLLRDDLDRNEVGICALSVVYAGPLYLNGLFHNGVNKNAVLLGETGKHIQAITAAHSVRGIRMIIDKQGGRNSYLPCLMTLFPGQWVDVVSEGPEGSHYRMPYHGRGVWLSFIPQGDRVSFPTALASMAAKYARECAMNDFNSWFGARIPNLKPTAGYPEDARRWLREAESYLVQAGIPRDMVVRNR